MRPIRRIVAPARSLTHLWGALARVLGLASRASRLLDVAFVAVAGRPKDLV
jgi:hypothetical protein